MAQPLYAGRATLQSGSGEELGTTANPVIVEIGDVTAIISDTAYNATSWDGVDEIAPSKNAIRDKIETLGGGGDLLANGTVPLTADWDAGDSSYDITAVEFKGALKGNADTVTTNANLTGDVTSTGNATDITESVLAVGGSDTVFPADPNADKYLMWDDDPGALSWESIAGGGDLLANGTVPMTSDWDIGNYDITLKALTGDGTIEGATLTEGGVAVSNDNEIEAVVEPLIDTLANLSSAGGQPVAFADAGADAFWGWDDAGGATYENLTDAEAMAIIGGAATDLDANGAVAWGNITAGEYPDNTIQANDIDTINCGTNATWDATNDEIDVDDAFLINDGNDTTTGVITAAGFTIGSAVMDETDLEKLDGITNGTGAANKAVVLDASLDIDLGTGDLLCTELDVSGNITNATIDPDLLSDEDQGDVNIDSDTWKVEEVQAGAISEAGDIDNDIITNAQIADADQTVTFGIWFEDPTADDDFKSIWANKTANDFIITKIWAESDGDIDFDLQVDDGSPADVNGADIEVEENEVEDTSMGGDATVAAGEELDLVVTAVDDSPTWVSIMWTGRWVD